MATVAYRRLALTPFPAGREQVIAKNVEHRRHPVAPGDLLPLGVGAAAVRDGQLPDARARLRQPRCQFDLDPEPRRRERQPLQQVRTNHLVARLHVREVQIGEHVGDEREEVVPDGVPEEQDAMRAALETGAVHGVSPPLLDGREQTRQLAPIKEGRADAVYGSRFQGGPHRVLFFWHAVGNNFLTLVSNMFTNLNLTDMETCYKMVRADLLKRLPLTATRFGIEVELTARLAQAGARIWELPISYSGRTYAEGKKITWRDGMAAMFHILRYNLFPPRGKWRER